MAHRLEKAVRDLLAVEFRHPASRRAVRDAIDARVNLLEATRPIATDVLDSRVSTLRAGLDRLAAALSRGTLTEARYDAQAAILRGELTEAEAERARIVGRVSHANRAPIDRQALYRMVDAMPTLLGRLEGRDARAAIVPWIAGATFDLTTRALTVAIRRVPAVDGVTVGAQSSGSTLLSSDSLAQLPELLPGR